MMNKQRGLISDRFVSHSGIVLGLALLGWAIFSQHPYFFNLQSLVIVCGGVLAASLISFPLSHILGVFESFRIVFSSQFDLHYDSVITEAVVLAIKCREVDSLTNARYILEEERKNLSHPFLRDGVALIAGGYTAQMIRETMETSISNRSIREANQVNVLKSMYKFSLGFGLLGILLNLSQTQPVPQALLPGIYGILLAYLVFLPMAEKLEVRRLQNMTYLNMMMMATLLLHARHHALYIEGVLNSFLSPGDRLTRFNTKGKFTGNLSLEKSGWVKQLFHSNRNRSKQKSSKLDTKSLKDEN